MRALLVNPWIYDFACFDLFSKPIGFLQIASCLKEAGFEIDYIDCLDRFHPALHDFLGGRRPARKNSGCGNYYFETAEKPSLFRTIPRRYKRYGMPPQLFKKLLNGLSRPQIILVTSGMTYWYQGVHEVIGELKKKFPRTPVILGGIYANLCYEHARAHSGADVVFRGSDFSGIMDTVSRVLNKNFSAPGKRPLPAYELYQGLPYVSLRTSNGCLSDAPIAGGIGLIPISFKNRPTRYVLK